MKLSYFFLLPVMALVGCTGEEEEQPFEGYFTYGHEVSDFRLCNESAYYWLNGESSSMKVIEQASLQLSEQVGEPYQAIYVKFMGFVDDRVPVGFEEETDGLLYMIELVEHSDQASAHCR
ncbi:hypothetical protein [Vibrio nomapromontoriensis]|uniref:hypothetical protein n=1 Tax=Vibrio nomapromontoriensis TaxID=2910246 RepID=UPI003D0DCED9